MTRRIALIVDSLAAAGTPKQVALLAAALPQSDFKVHVVALTRGGSYEEALRGAGLPVTLIGQRGWADAGACWRLFKALRRLRPDLVHTWGAAANFCGRTTALAAGVKALVAGYRCVDPLRTGAAWAADRRLARRTARLVAVSRQVRDFYVAGGLPAEKFVEIHNGVESAGPPLASTDVRAEFSIPPHAHLIAWAGLLRPYKRLKDVIWAAELLKVIRDDVHLLILGDGPQRAALMRYRDLVLIQDKVHFLGQRCDAAAVIGQCDLLWLGSAYEGQPNSVMEALVAGVPVVSTDIPGVRDLVTHGQHGYLVPIGDRAALARYANKLIDEPELRAHMGAAGRERMQREFSVAAMAGRYAELYHDLIQ
jgi:glycosyltransferase involved in cell wall biosynthesis